MKIIRAFQNWRYRREVNRRVRELRVRPGAERQAQSERPELAEQAELRKA